jgi:hypothetical protein
VAPGTPGHVGWHELHADNLESSFAFYADLFGWTKAEAVDMGPMGIYQTFATDGAPCGAHDGQDAANASAILALLFQYRGCRCRDETRDRQRRPDHPRPHAGSRWQLDRQLPRPAGRHLRNGRNEMLITLARR